ncbi:MAG: hypothetical protein ACI4AE_04805 [Candidatus Cryptobacteroides sp.]
MKLFRYITIIAAASFVLASCQEESTGQGNATVGFRDREIEVRENVGTIKIPFVFEGEAAKYPVTFDVDIEVEGGFELEEAMHITQYRGLKYMGDPSVPVYLECQVINDDIINDPKVLHLTLANVQGATVADNPEITVSITDNDNNPYDKLCGEYIFSSMFPDGNGGFTPYKFIVTVCGGFTTDEIADNYEKTLVCWGFAGYQDDLTGMGFKPVHSPVWYLDYNLEEKSLTLRNDELMASNFILKQSGGYVEIKSATAVPDGSNWYTFEDDVRLKGTWSDDMKTITFDDPSQKGYGIAGLVYETPTSIPLPFAIFTNITMTQK